MNELKINIPEGYTIDKDNTNLEEGIIKFKKEKYDTWEDIKIYLWNHNKITSGIPFDFCINDNICYESFNYLVAYNRLYCIALCLNGDWKPKISATTIVKGYSIKVIKSNNGKIEYISPEDISGTYHILGSIYFKDKESAEQAIKLMGDGIKYLF